MLALCRAAAWLIVLAGIVDPIVALTRTIKPEVALVSDLRLPDPSLVDRVERVLSGRFTVIRGPLDAGRPAAVVSLGYQLPRGGARASGRGFAVVPKPRAPFVAITAVTTADRPLLQSRLPVDVSLRAVAAAGRTVAVTLRRDGVAIDRITTALSSDDATARVRLQFTPTATGPAVLTVEAEIGDTARATATFRRTVRDDRWRVLFFDRRPSWMSTFVRRALASDPRFVVTSRVATSKAGPAITAGQPPASLATLPSLDGFDTLVVGAPEDLTEPDSTGLSRWMRERGGTAMLLLDEQDPSKHSPALRRLTGMASWTLTDRADPSGTPPASVVLTPAPLPDWAEPLGPGGDDAAVWRLRVGRGALVVSGALDSWRFREKDDDAFGLFWRDVVGGAADEAARRPAEDTSVQGLEPDERALVHAWAQSRGGQVFEESALRDLSAALDRVLAPASERRPTRLMQSPWWMAPLALALGTEWWVRRRRGQR